MSSDVREGRPAPEPASYPQPVLFRVTVRPARSLPIGFAENGLPIGLRIVGRAVEETTVLRVAAALEA